MGKTSNTLPVTAESAVQRAYRPGKNPNSLKNLKPAQPGDIRNPTGKNRNRPYTDAYEGVAEAPLPEFLRLQLNNRLRTDLRNKRLPDFYSEGITWAEANALRQHLNALIDGDTRSATEVREAVEGRATQRVELAKKNDRLLALIDALRAKRENSRADQEKTIPAVSHSQCCNEPDTPTHTP
jgi:hypothetical protein